MTDKIFRAEDYLNGKAELPANFDTGYRRHLETAREIVRHHKGAVGVTSPAPSQPRELTSKALSTA